MGANLHPNHINSLLPVTGAFTQMCAEARILQQVLEIKLVSRNLPGSLCFVRLEVGVGGGVVPVPWAFDTYVDSVDSREPAG